MITFDSSRPDFAPYGFTCERWTPKLMPRPDRHNEIEVNLLTSGSLTYLFGGTKVTIKAGRMAVFWAGIPHQIVQTSSGADYFVATIPLVWFLQCQFPEHFVHAILHAHVVIDSGPSQARGDEEMFERWLQDFQVQCPLHQRLVLLEMEARLLRVALAVSRQKPLSRQNRSVLGTRSLSCVEQMAYFIARNYTEAITSEKISRSTGLHPNYAMSLFKNTFGMTLIDCVTQHRVSHARRLLATTDKKVVDVAINSGFNSLSRFNEAFKKSCGCSPRKYRINNRPSSF
jgi:AraC-like DNA-binding protein